MPRQRGSLTYAEVLLTVISAIIPAIPSMPVLWRVVFGFVAWVLLWHLMSLEVKYFRRVPRVVLFGRLACVTVWIVIALWVPIENAWKAEQAALLEGDLIGAGQILDDGKTHGFPNVQIGQTTLIMTPNGTPVVSPFFPDAGVRSEWGKISPLFSTTIRDVDGHLIATVARNHWQVYPPYFGDKNYTKTALEIKNSAGHVVLRVRILLNAIDLQGEWWDTEGKGIRMVGSLNGSLVMPLGVRNQHDEALIQPMFEYPSKYHWGELARPHPPYVP